MNTALRTYIACATLILALSGLPGCRVGPDHCCPPTPIPDLWHQQLEEGEFVGSRELDQWWMMLQDPMLDELIDSVGYANLSLDAAYARICQARSQRCAVRSAKGLQLNSEGSFQTTLQSGNAFGGGGFANFFSRDLWSLQGLVSWEPDVFGRIHRQIESADANVCSQIEAYRDILVSLHGDVAQTYVQVRTLQKQLEYAHENVEIQEQALKVAQARVDAGKAANIDQFQAESNLAATRAEIPPLEQQLHQALNRLSVLMGHCPGSLHDPLALPAPIPQVPPNLPLTVPCEWVRQRPDIRQAERLIAARTADVGVAVADLFPRFSLGGNFGLQSQNFSDLFSSGSWGYGFGPSFSWPIFNAFRILCNIEGAEAAVRESIANYEQTVLRAMEEVENALVGYRKEKVRRESLAKTVTAAQQSLESVLALYREGKVDFQNVLDTLRTLFQAQNSLAISEGQVVSQFIAIYRALGGGWDPQHHCLDRCVRAACPGRGDPSVVEQIPTSGQADRYFDMGRDPAPRRSGAASPRDPFDVDLSDVLPEGGTGAPSELPAGEPNRLESGGREDEDSDSVLDRVLQRR